MKTYIGDRTIDGVQVSVDGKPLEPRLDLAALSRNGFEWSYEGPEPQQLAFAMLMDHTGNATLAQSLSEPFMREVVANFDNEWEMTAADIDAAIAALRARA